MIFRVIPAAGLFDFLQQIAEFLGSIIQLVVQLVFGIVRLLQIIPTAVMLLTESIGMLPSILVAFASVTITVCVIFIILGRDHGGGS